MKKILLLTTTILLSSATVYAVCNPNLPACQCAYPKMVNGIIGCTESYCEEGTKCMPDGSCCPQVNYCKSTELGKQCCEDGQSCDTTKGCVEVKDIEALCAAAENGYFHETGNGYKLCLGPVMTWYDALAWCEKNGMTMPSMKELCPSWNGDYNEGRCLELEKEYISMYWVATSVSDETALVYAAEGGMFANWKDATADAGPLCW